MCTCVCVFTCMCIQMFMNYVNMYVHIMCTRIDAIGVYNKTSLNRPTMGLTLSGPFREMVGSGS